MSKRKTLEVGFKYKCKRNDKVYHIIHRQDGGDRPFLGYCKDFDSFTSFDANGDDEWFMCGGHWWALDLESKKPAGFRFSEVET